MGGGTVVLVLNRRPGESVLIEGDLVITVLSARERAVWLKVAGPEIARPLLLGVSAVSTNETRLEIAAPIAATVDESGVCVELAGPDHPAVASRTTLSLVLLAGNRVNVGAKLEVGVAPSEHGHPCLVLGGPAIGPELRVACIRPAGSCVRLGVDAPGRRVYRMELWEALVAANQAAAGAEDDLFEFTLSQVPAETVGVNP